MQKDGYKRMLQWVANRRRNNREFDLQVEELKLLNMVRILNDGGWVCDKPALETMLKDSGVK